MYAICWEPLYSDDIPTLFRRYSDVIRHNKNSDPVATIALSPRCQHGSLASLPILLPRGPVAGQNNRQLPGWILEELNSIVEVYIKLMQERVKLVISGWNISAKTERSKIYPPREMRIISWRSVIGLTHGQQEINLIYRSGLGEGQRWWTGIQGRSSLQMTL